MRWGAAALAAALMLAGCSASASGGGAGTTQPIPSPPTTSAATTPADSAPRQWGSLIAGLEAPVRLAARKIANCNSFDYGPGAVACTLGPLSFDFVVQTFSIKLHTGAARLGDPPSEVATLVVATKADARAVHATNSRVTAVCGRTLTAHCQRVLFSFYQARDALLADLDAWRPYTG